MYERRYMRVDIGSILDSLSDRYQLSKDAMKLMELDLCSGMSREQVMQYCTKNISVGRMKIISDCIRHGVDEGLIEKLSAEERSDEVMGVVFKLLDKGVELAAFEDRLDSEDRLLDLLNGYMEQLAEAETKKDLEGLADEVKEVAEETEDKEKTVDEAKVVSKSEGESNDFGLFVGKTVKSDISDSKAVTKSKDNKEPKNIPEDGKSESKTESVPEPESVSETESPKVDEHAHKDESKSSPVTDGMEIKELFSSLKDEIMAGVSSAIVNSTSQEDKLRKEFDEKLLQIESRLKEKDEQLKEKENQLEHQSKVIDEVKKEMEEMSRQIHSKESHSEHKKIVYSMPYEDKRADSCSEPIDETLDLTKGIKASDMEGRTLKVIDSNGRVISSLPVERNERKSSGLGGICAALGIKKRSRRSLMQLSINGELSREQLICIVEAIRCGLTENQLCNLIENKVPAERMPQIIQIAKLENEMGYNG